MARGQTEGDSATKPTAERSPSTPEMDAHQAEEMANSMMWNSPLPNVERSDEKLLEEDGSGKLPREGGGEKLPEEIPTSKLIIPLPEGLLPFVLLIFCNPSFFL